MNRDLFSYALKKLKKKIQIKNYKKLKKTKFFMSIEMRKNKRNMFSFFLFF